LLSFSPKYFVFPFHIKKLNIKIYKNVTLPVVLYECETLSLTLREEHILRVEDDIWSKKGGRQIMEKITL
jgi:hypothetical protein